MTIAFGLCLLFIICLPFVIVGGAIEWLYLRIRETLDAFAQFSAEGRLQ